MKLQDLHEDASILTNSLAGLIGYLRARSYHEISEDSERALQGTADGFEFRLREHLRDEDVIIFPSLKEILPERGADLEGLKAEHRAMRRLAGNLSELLRKGSLDRAYEVGRTFLAALFHHMDRESRILDTILKELGPEREQRLREILLDRRVRSAVQDLQPQFSEWKAALEVAATDEDFAKIRIRRSGGLATGLHSLRARLERHLKRRVPELRKIEFDYEDTGR